MYIYGSYRKIKTGLPLFGPPCRYIFHSFLTAVDRWRHQCCPTTTRQVIARRPDSYQCSETGRWSGCTIYRRTVNRSLSAGHFPEVFRLQAFVSAVVKKQGARWYVTDVSSYRPISNLSVLSKLLERLVFASYWIIWRPLISYQLHSRFSSRSFDRNRRAARAVRYSSCCRPWTCGCSGSFGPISRFWYGRPWYRDAASTFGIHDVAQQWIKSYLSGRTQYVRHGANKSSITRLMCGVPQAVLF